MQLEQSIVIVGKICSGKSTLAKELSSKLKLATASFGGYLVKYSTEHQIEIVSRDTLQDLGNKFIKEAPEQFLDNVILHSGQPDKLIFEGVRHLIIFDLIKKRSKKFFSIFLDIDQQERYRRIQARGKDTDRIKDFDDFLRFDNHIVEQEIDLLKDKCNLTVTQNYDTDIIIDYIDKNK